MEAGKDSEHQEERGAGDSLYLKRALGNVLPTAMATVVQLQPSDPIETLALCLYKYRQLNPQPEAAMALEADDDGNPFLAEPETLNMASPHNAKWGPVKSYDEQYLHCDKSGDTVRITFDNGECDMIDPGNTVSTSLYENSLHAEARQQFHEIGDLFDDDDLG